MGKLLAINISKERGTEKREVPQAELVADYGIMGDAHAGKWHRQVSLLSAEKIDAFRARGAQIDNGAFGENLIISGFDFKNLPLGTRFCIGNAILEMTQIGKQCHSHCAIYKRMGECIMPKEGVFAVVIRGGQIHTGDEVKLIPANIYASIKDRPADSRCELLTVIEGAHAGEKALYIDGRIRVASGSAWADEINDNDNSIVMFKQQIGSRPRLIICGGGHVSAALVRMASLLAFDIWVIEDRPLFADNAKRQGADHVICGDYKKTLARLEPQTDDYYVCMTRGHRFDMECLTEIFRKPYAYVGMMGSKKRAVIVKKDLEESGFSQETISGLHSPIGLAIGGQTPEEIALSVISEIVKCKNERTSCTQIDNEVLDALIEAAKQHVSDAQKTDAQEADAQKADTHYQNEKYILCTIIKKNGSAPRGVGTQMLVSSDNRIVGTIGGGCAEAEVISHCRRLFRKQEFKCELIDVSMNTDDAEKEGMVCGGSISVLLEQAPISAADSNENAACNSEGTEQLRKERLKA